MAASEELSQAKLSLSGLHAENAKVADLSLVSCSFLRPCVGAG